MSARSYAESLPSAKFPPTDEQVSIVDAIRQVQKGDVLRITAYAGAGKTSTLKLVADALNHRDLSGRYICLNKSIADEAGREFPSNIECSTAHSLAYRAMRVWEWGVKMGNISLGLIRQNLDLGSVGGLSEMALSGIVRDTLNRFLHSADFSMEEKHVPVGMLQRMDEIKERAAEKEGTQYVPMNIDAIAHTALESARRIWTDLQRKGESSWPMPHDAYLKMWQLSSPRINADVLLLDEAQDTNPVLMDVFARQSHAIRVLVGDEHQQIYAWRGAVDAMSRMNDFVEEERISDAILSQSFRFPQVVADIATICLRQGKPRVANAVSIKGFDQCADGNGKTAFISRTNAAVIRSLIGMLEEVPARDLFVVGGVWDMVRLVEDINDIETGALESSGKEPKSPELFGVKTTDDLDAVCESDTQIASVRRLISDHGAGELIYSLKRLQDNSERHARYVFTTAHKSKGREWSHVRLGPDFRAYSDAEINLLYVALTRAQNTLDFSMCPALRQALAASALHQDVIDGRFDADEELRSYLKQDDIDPAQVPALVSAYSLSVAKAVFEGDAVDDDLAESYHDLVSRMADLYCPQNRCVVGRDVETEIRIEAGGATILQVAGHVVRHSQEQNHKKGAGLAAGA